jgi:hypothetical protein
LQPDLAPSGPAPTPARCAYVQQLVASGRLTAGEGAALIVDGRVDDVNWEHVRQLGE